MYVKTIMLGIIAYVLCYKNYRIDEYLNNCTSMKSLIHDSVITCDEIIDTADTVSINSITYNLCTIFAI